MLSLPESSNEEEGEMPRMQKRAPRIHLINPSDNSFGIAVITPRWLFVLAGATPAEYGDPHIVDECLEQIDAASIQPGDVVGIGIHTGNALRGMEVGRMARERGAFVVYGGPHATLYPQEPLELGAAHAVVKGDGDQIWGRVIRDVLQGLQQPVYEGGRVAGDGFVRARWDLMPKDRYMWASVQTVRGCPKHCSFCSVWRTDGQKPRQNSADMVLEEVVELRRLGFRFVVLADDNFYPVTLTDIALAEKQGNAARLAELRAIREERFELMRKLAQLPKDMILFTQITMEASEDLEFLKAMRAARIRGALVGVESVTEAGLKSVFKEFNASGDDLVTQLSRFREHGIHVLGSFIFGLPSDGPETFAATGELAQKAGLAFAQFVMLTPFPGTVDFDRWEKSFGDNIPQVEGKPVTRFWLIPSEVRPKLVTQHPTMSNDEVRRNTQKVWDDYYSLPMVWERAKIIPGWKGRLAFVLISKLYRQMYANQGISTDSARRRKANRIARLIIKPCRRLFAAAPMPELILPASVGSRIPVADYQ
jgi:tRNA A37 methylthiotransferase MiaB